MDGALHKFRFVLKQFLNPSPVKPEIRLAAKHEFTLA